jgi:hypothetical protein
MTNGYVYSILKPQMFRNWNKVDPEFLRFLDIIVAGAGWTPFITSDWRDPAHEAKLPGGVPTSLHLIGRAVDIRMPMLGLVPDKVKIGELVDAICLYRKGIQVEFEIEITPGNAHLHVGLFKVSGPLRIITRCAH